MKYFKFKCIQTLAVDPEEYGTDFIAGETYTGTLSGTDFYITSESGSDVMIPAQEVDQYFESPDLHYVVIDTSNKAIIHRPYDRILADAFCNYMNKYKEPKDALLVVKMISEEITAFKYTVICDL